MTMYLKTVKFYSRMSLFIIPSLNNLYTEQGYKQGLRIEKELGKHISSFVQPPNRIYHFSDSCFLYVEEYNGIMPSIQELTNAIQENITSFPLINKLDNNIINIGIVDYPFLSKAYMAIDEHQLIDILLTAIRLAQQLGDNHQHQKSRWVYLRAIENAPAASFADDNIRSSVEKAIEQGLIKVDTSQDKEKNP